MVKARNELIEILRAGLEGDYDEVTATRVWREIADETSIDATDSDDADRRQTDNEEEPPGFVDILAEAEARNDDLFDSTTEVGEHIRALGDLAHASTDDLEKSDARGDGMRGRLSVLARFASGADEIADELEASVVRYRDALNAVSAGMNALVERMESDPSTIEDGVEFGTSIRGLARTSRASLANLAGFVDTLIENARMSRVLRRPSSRVAAALKEFAEVTEVLDELDRRLQTLGIPVPPEVEEDDELIEETPDEGE